MKIDIKIDNPCLEPRSFCVNCHSEFMMLRPSIKSVVVSKHFIRDLKDEEKMNSLIKSILDCSHMDFYELHKFEENINGNLIFRAKKEGTHIVYCVDKDKRIIFLRAMRNFTEYKKFLENRKEILRIIRASV
jgi:mRNA-degrading endonuclease RelE of RelBE toxin-antitoxin system